MSEGNAVQVLDGGWSGLQAVGEDSWRLLLEMFLSSQDICDKSRQTYSWVLMRYFDWLKMTDSYERPLQKEGCQSSAIDDVQGPL